MKTYKDLVALTPEALKFVSDSLKPENQRWGVWLNCYKIVHPG